MNIMRGGAFEASGTISEAAADSLSIALDDGTALRLRPTPSDYPPPAFESDLPFEDWIS